MSASVPLIEITDVVKGAGGPAPFRVKSLQVGSTERIVVSGLDAVNSELAIHLITGAAVPDEGTVRIAGLDTRSIATDKDWLTSLDRFGLVSGRAVLLDSLPVAANLALPLTLAIEPMNAETRAAVEALADEVAVPRGVLDHPISTLDQSLRLRVHLARALANGPELLLLEHPTASLDNDGDRAAFARTLSAATSSRGIGWLAFTTDDLFARASGGVRTEIDVVTGTVRRARSWWPFVRGMSRG